MSKNLLLSLVHDRRKRETKTQPGKVELVIVLDKRMYLSTGISCHKKNWRGQVCGLPDADELNESLNVLKRKVRSVYNELAEQGPVTIDDLKILLTEKSKPKPKFIEYIKERVAVRSEFISERTAERYRMIAKYLEDWGGMSTFIQVTERNIYKLDESLKGRTEATKWNYHKVVKFLIDDAIKDGFLKTNPYNNVKIKKGKVNSLTSRMLTKEEFERFKEVHTWNRTLIKCKDLFLLQVYTTMGISDLKAFRYKDCVREDGYLVYKSKRIKTDQEFVIVINDKALEILKKYNYEIPSISLPKYNDHLKVLATMADIDKPVSSHYARHTGASLLLNSGVRMEVVSKILGHSKIETTERVYAKIYDSTIIKEMSKV